MERSGVVVVILLFALAQRVEPANQCVMYSWLGPDSLKQFNKSELLSKNSIHLSNRTCKDFPKPKPIPCISPFIVGKDDVTSPNPTDVLNNFNEAVTCLPGKGNVCAIVAWYFGKEVVNMTAYCTRVTIDGTQSMKQGCISGQKGAYSNTVCVCEGNLCNLNLKITNGMSTQTPFYGFLMACF